MRPFRMSSRPLKRIKKGANEANSAEYGQTKSQSNHHRVKIVRILSYSGLHFPAFGLNSERYSASVRIHCKCGKMQTRIIPNTDTSYAAHFSKLNQRFKRASKYRTSIHTCQLRWIIQFIQGATLRTSSELPTINYFHKKLHLRCLTGF